MRSPFQRASERQEGFDHLKALNNPYHLVMMKDSNELAQQATLNQAQTRVIEARRKASKSHQQMLYHIWKNQDEALVTAQRSLSGSAKTLRIPGSINEHEIVALRQSGLIESRGNRTASLTDDGIYALAMEILGQPNSFVAKRKAVAQKTVAMDNASQLTEEIESLMDAARSGDPKTTINSLSEARTAIADAAPNHPAIAQLDKAIKNVQTNMVSDKITEAVNEIGSTFQAPTIPRIPTIASYEDTMERLASKVVATISTLQDPKLIEDLCMLHDDVKAGLLTESEAQELLKEF